jgi:hypothetical protein
MKENKAPAKNKQHVWRTESIEGEAREKTVPSLILIALYSILLIIYFSIPDVIAIGLTLLMPLIFFGLFLFIIATKELIKTVIIPFFTE